MDTVPLPGSDECSRCFASPPQQSSEILRRRPRSSARWRLLGLTGAAFGAWSVVIAAQVQGLRPATAASTPPSTAASPTSSTGPSDPDYRIGSADALSVRVLQAEELNAAVRVSEQGQISLPLLGLVPAAGLTAHELEESLEARLREKYIRHPDVTVTVTDIQSRGVSVVGAVRKPGTVQVKDSTTLLDLLSLAGGLADDAGDTIVVLPGPEASQAAGPQTAAAREINVKLLMEAHTPGLNVTVHPGDVVNVHSAAVVYVVGAVKKPGAFTVPGNDRLTVLRAVALGEGLLTTAAGADAVVIRTDPSGKRTEVPVNVTTMLKGKTTDMPLEAQDVLFVPLSGARVATKGTLEFVSRILTLRMIP